MHKINILLVDDKAANIYALNTFLRTNDEIEDIYESLSVKEALDTLMNKRVDLILSDIQMPEINGFEFIKILKKNIKTKNIPFIFMTAAYDNEKFEKEGYALGAVDYITKPIDEVILRQKLSKYIEILHAYKKIEQQQVYISKILEASDEAHIVVDDSMNIVDYNKKAKSIFANLSHIKTLGKLLEEEEEEEEEERLSFIYEAIGLSKNKTYTFKHKKKYYKMRYKKLDEKLFMMSFFDITHEVKENKRKDVIYNSQKAIVLVTDGKNIKNINSAFFEEFGFANLEDFKKKHSCICELFINKDGREYLMPDIDGVRWNKYIDTHSDRVHEVMMVNKLGAEKIYEVKTSGNLFEEEEEEEEEVVVFSDVTDIQAKNQMLLLQSRQAAMGEMISMIAHQWRQPLTSISLTLLRMNVQYELGGFSSGEFKQNSQKIEDIIVHLSKTVDLFGDYFKEKEGSMVSLKKLFGDVQTIISPIMEKNFIEFLYDEAGFSNSDNYEVDNRVDQVLLNIYQNAIDALKDDNCLEEKHIKTGIHIDEKASKLCITICDNAGGIDAKIIEKIFNPYFSTKSKNGSGIGLYMSKEMVEKHVGGSLRAYNVQDGACFEIKLPLGRLLK